MRRTNLERFLYQFDKDVKLKNAFRNDPVKALEIFNLVEEEATAVISGDVVTMLRWGLHPLLIRNYAGTRKIDYLSEYKKAGY